MLLGSGDKTILAVEGDSDRRYFKKIVDNTNISIVVCNGRDTVCQLVEQLAKAFNGRVVGVCDRDFLHFGLGDHKGDEIYHTDEHDLQMDALAYNGEGFSGQLGMICSPDKLEQKFLNVDSLIDMAFGIALPISCLRYISEEEGLGIKFTNYKFKGKPICDADFNPNVRELIKCVLESIDGQKYLLKELDELEQKVIAKLSSEFELYQMCNGHDFISALKVVLKKYSLGGQNKAPDELSLTNSLLGSYTKSSFQNSNLGIALGTRLSLS